MESARAMSKLFKKLGGFKKSIDGNIASTFALAMVPLMFSVGAAVDYSRYSNGFAKLVNAGDSAILAASRKMTGSGEDNDDALQAELEEEFDKFLEANFDNSRHGITFTRELSFDRDAQTVTVNVTGEMKTSFLNAMGVPKLTYEDVLGTRLETTPENYVLDIVMCIDATGSMQNTLNSVQANASTFDSQLRDELNIDSNDERFKVRIRPIYYRDYEDSLGGYGWHWTEDPGYGYVWTGSWWSYGYWTVNHMEYGSYPADATRALKPAPDFYDLDKTSDTTEFQTFLNSESASGGGNLPEASGACLNEGMRSDWYDRDETNDFPEDEHVTVFPIIVTWTDAAIRTLSVTAPLSSGQPTSYSSFETLWGNEGIIPQDPKLLVLFGPETYSGWSTVRNWDGYEYGGSISTGNSQAITVIADKIVKVLPDVLRLTN